MAKAELIAELWTFMKTRKRYWLLPVVIVLVGLGLLIILAETSAVAPFIYTVF